MIIGSGGKKVKSIIEETGVEAIDTQDDGIVRSDEDLILGSIINLLQCHIFVAFAGENYCKGFVKLGEVKSYN